MNFDGYLKTIKTISYHNNLGIDIIKQLCDKDILICGTVLFWEGQGRTVSGDIDSINIPVYKYRYTNIHTGESVKYSDMTPRELKQAVKIGLVDKQEYVSSYKELEIIRLENTVGKKFESKEFDINYVKLMQEIGTYDLNRLISILIEETDTPREIKIDIEDALGWLMGQSSITDVRLDNVDIIVEQLIKVIDFIDTKVERRKLIDLKREKLDELADNIICTIEAMNIRKIIGGADV